MDGAWWGPVALKAWYSPTNKPIYYQSIPTRVVNVKEELQDVKSKRSGLSTWTKPTTHPPWMVKYLPRYSPSVILFMGPLPSPTPSISENCFCCGLITISSETGVTKLWFYFLCKGLFILALQYIAAPTYQLLSAATQHNPSHSKLKWI